MKIPLLLIDDDQELGPLLQEYLEGEFLVQSAFDGITGLQEALRHAYRAVILDMMLPGMSGLEVLELLRKERSIPVLVLTACGDDQNRRAALELGADDYLAKPFQPQELLKRLRGLLAG